MYRRRFLASVPAGSVAGIAGCFDRGYEGTAADGPPRLGVEGRWVTDPEGNPVVLRGVSVVDPKWGVENADDRGKDYWETLRLATDESAGWHARVLRIPVEPRSIRAAGVDEVVEEYLDRAVELAAERDAYLLIAYQAVERYDTPSIERRLRAFWDAVAPRYADESHVLYELFGAPTEPASGGIEAWRTWREYASPWLTRVRERAPETPIVVGSPAWSSMARYAAEEPLEHDDLLYAAHVYPSWEPRSWASAFGTPSFEVPVFVTEWGYAADGPTDHALGTTAEWGEPFREWLDAHENVHWCASTFDSRRQPAMFDTDWEPLGGDDRAGALVKDWLADRRDDHRPGESTPIPSGEGEPPDPPAVDVDGISETRATVRWDATTESYDDGVLQYRVRFGERDARTLRGVEGSLEYIDLEPGRSYEVAVTAVDRRGLESRPGRVEFRTTDRYGSRPAIPRTGAVAGIDDETWDAVEGHPIDRYLWGHHPPGIEADWRAAWNDEALYVHVDVDEPDDGTDAVVEVYLDLDGSREESYDGRNDFQLLVSRNGSLDPGFHSAPPSWNTRAETAETDDGWETLLAVPWEDYDVRPAAGDRIGMDVHLSVHEDHDMIGKIGWYDESDDAWEFPNRFAVVELGE